MHHPRIHYLFIAKFSFASSSLLSVLICFGFTSLASICMYLSLCFLNKFLLFQFLYSLQPYYNNDSGQLILKSKL